MIELKEVAVPGTALHAQCYEEIRRDPTYIGRIFIGVHSTGIYCVPNCPARPPLPKNVKFYPTAAMAEAAGLRPCKRCKPDRLDLFDEEAKLKEVIAKLRANPDEMKGVDNLAKATGWKAGKLNALCHIHYHATPAHLIAQARIAWAQEQLQKGTDAGEVGIGCGYESLSGFYEQFKRFTCMTPGDYRDIAKATTAKLSWPERFNLGIWKRYLGRDPESASEKLSDNSYRVALHLDGQPAILTLTWDEAGLELSVGGTGVNQCPEGAMFKAHAIACRLLGTAQDLDGFRGLMIADPADSALLHEGCVLRIPQTVNVWDGIVWAILGQQVNIPFAARLRARLVQTAGTPVGDLVAFPTPEQVAKLTVEELKEHQFSERKAEYVIGIAKAIVDGTIHPETWPLGPASQIERSLLDLRGIGPWAANYILMRACGFMDATPLGDTGLTSGLQRRFQVERPNAEGTKELMKRYAPYRSLATYHLWQSLRQGVA